MAPAEFKLISRKQFAVRRGVSKRSIENYQKSDPLFPKGHMINGRMFFVLPEVEKYEREILRKAAELPLKGKQPCA